MPKERAEKIVSVLNFSDYMEFPTDNENEREIVKTLSMTRINSSQDITRKKTTIHLKRDLFQGQLDLQKRHIDYLILHHSH